MCDFSMNNVIFFFQISAILLDCEAGYSPRIEIIDGIQATIESFASFQTHTPEACLYSCMKNMVVLKCLFYRLTRMP